MPAVEDWVNIPQETVQRIFEQSGLAECHKKVAAYFSNRISQGSLKTIPSLNDAHLQSLKANTIVRFRCMIQDMFDPEYFLGTYEVLNSVSGRRTLKCGLYQDVASCQNFEEIDFDSARNITHDRLSYYCISVPGENQWVKKNYSERYPFQSSPCASTSTAPVRSKRSYEDASNGPDDMEVVEVFQQKERDSKRSRSAPQTQANINNSAEQFPEMNFPLPGMVGKACIVKLYDQSLELKMNDVVEFIGILSVDPAVSLLPTDSDADSPPVYDHNCFAEIQAHNPPASLIPRLHAVIVHQLEHNNPCVPRNLKTNQNDQSIQELASECSVLREGVLSILTEVFLGDKLVAEYFLCHLISSVYVRHDIVALGKFCLNIMNVPVAAGYSEKLYNIISDLVTQSYLLPLSLENLNTLSFVPAKNYSTNRLTTGVLQLSNNTHLIIDETALMSGQLNAKGVKNMAALKNLIQWQRVEYDFSFHKVDYLTDIPVLILSEGKSLLPSDFVVTMHQNINAEDIERRFQNLKHNTSGNVLSKTRNYLTFLKLANYGFSSDLQKVVENDFVEMRRTGQCVSADDLHALLVLARLLSLSMGQMTLNVETWERAKSMEMSRKSHLPPRFSN